MMKLANFTLLILVFLFSCSKKPPLNQEAPKESRLYSKEEEKSIARDLFLRARKLEFEKKPKIALEYYEKAFFYDSTNEGLSYIIAEKCLELGYIDKAQFYLEKGFSNTQDTNQIRYKLAGEIYLQSGNTKKSLEYYQKAYLKDTTDREILYILSNLYEQTGDTKNQAATLNLLLPLMNYPQSWVDKKVQLDYSLGNIQEVVNTYKKSWEETQDPYFGEKLGNTYESLELYQNFHEVFLKLSSQDTANPYYQIQIARSYLFQNKTDSSVLIYSDLAKKYPENENVLFPYATLLFLKKEFSQAREYFIKLIQLNQENPEYHYYLALTAMELKDFELAEIRFRKSIALNKKSLEYWLQLATLYIETKSYTKAQNLMVEFSNLGNEPGNLLLRGGVYKSIAFSISEDAKTDSSLNLKISENFNVSNQIYRKGISLYPKDSRLWFELGVVLERSGKFDSAVKAFEKVIELDTNHATALNYVGYMLVEKGIKLEKGIQYIDRALKISPNNPAFLDSKGWYYYQTGNYKKAQEYIERSLAAGMDDPTILEHLAFIFEKMGNTDKALETWKRILKIDPLNLLAKRKLNL